MGLDMSAQLMQQSFDLTLQFTRALSTGVILLGSKSRSTTKVYKEAASFMPLWELSRNTINFNTRVFLPRLLVPSKVLIA